MGIPKGPMVICIDDRLYLQVYDENFNHVRANHLLKCVLFHLPALPENVLSVHDRLTTLLVP